MKKNIYYLLFILLPTIFIISGCSNNFNNSLTIGVNLELTGVLAQYGGASLNGIVLATEEVNAQGGINGKKIVLKVLDNRSSTTEAALSAHRLQHLYKVDAIIGPSTSGGVKASLGSGITIPVITPTATANDLRISGSKNVYRMCFTDNIQGEKMGEFASKLGFKNVGMILNLSSDYSINSGENFKNSIESHGGKIITTEYYKSGDNDFNALLTKIKGINLDAIYFPGYYTEGGLIIKQARQLGINSAFLSGDAFDSPELEHIIGKNGATDIYFTNHYYPDKGKIVGFSEQYYKSFNEYPTSYSSLSYDSANILYLALKNCNGDYSDLVNQLDNIRDFQGITGTFSINENRDADKEVLLNQIKDGKRYGVDFS